MKIVSNEKLREQLQWRYATKRFDAARKISQEDWETLEECLRLSPSSFGLQPWKFIVVQDQELRRALRPKTWDQPQIEEASHLVVFTVKKQVNALDVERLMTHIAETRDIPRASLADYQRLILGFLTPDFDAHAWAIRQVYLALGQFLTAAALLGIDACPMEGFEPAAYDRLLKLEESGYNSVVLVTAGFRASDDPYAHAKKVRFAATDIIEYR